MRDLRYDFPKVEALLQQGEEIKITKRGKPFARLIPPAPEFPNLPDFAARIKQIYKDEVLNVSGLT